MSSSHRLGFLLCGVLACSLLLSCRDREATRAVGDRKEKQWSQSQAALEYRLIQTELKLAQSGKPYMVLDFTRNLLDLKLKGATVWNYPIEIAETDSSELDEFIDRFMGNDHALVRPLMFKYLFASKAQTPDSILAIISDATMFSAELMQREIPERFQLLWSEDVILDVRTDITGVPKSKSKNTIIQIRQAISRPFGNAMVTIKMPKERALTLYRVSTPGFPALIYPRF
jgi:hypothetical protein